MTNPLDASKFSAEPCRALKPNQAAQLNVDDGKARKGNLGMVCDWSGLESGSLIDLQFLQESHEGLSSIYRANTNGGYDIFKPIADLEGFPAVVLGDDDDKDIGMCTVDVGLSDELVIQISTTQSEQRRGTVDPCAAAQAVAQWMLQNMKAGA